MTEQPNEEHEDVYPLLGAIGPYLSFTTGHMNPVEESFAEYAKDDLPINTPENTDWPVDEPAEVVYPENSRLATEPDDDQDYWTDEEE